MTVRQLRLVDERCLCANNCPYCVGSHTAAARKAWMTHDMFGELQAVVGMANETNRLANGYRVPLEDAFTLAD
ncbi:carboxymuconolactone decarboxylase family protein [Pseudomonas purpurea]|uniref:carboxymuconolactone decarboxylase family protein n=1 Tax=Pseudomonas purpurea TaxID=3136737 RepID=UPI003263AB3D